MSYDIYIVGLGMVGPRHFTKEAEWIIENSEKSFVGHFQSEVHYYIENELETKVVDLNEEYKDKKERFDTYERMKNRVIEEVKNGVSPVSVGFYGHPTYFVSPTRLIKEEAEGLGYNVDVTPGISAIDCIYTDILFDPSLQGVQMYEATDLMVREFPLNNQVPVFLWQIGSIETGLYDSNRDNRAERFSRIREYLERYYPKDQPAYLIKTSTYPFTESEVIGFEIGNFENVSDRIETNQTLYIPPIEHREVKNKELLDKINSVSHLERITK